MKFPLSIVLLLVLLGSIIIFAVNTDIDYVKLDESSYISPEFGSIKMTTNLYFVYQNALRRETKSITISDSNYAKSILESISYGSENDYFKSIYDFGVRIISTDIINETCYVNFYDTPELIELFKDDHFDLYIWAIVNSLTENNKVKNVQFLVEGKQYSRSMRGFNLNAPLTKLDAIVYTKEKNSADTVLEFLDYMSTLRYDLAYSLLTEASMNAYNYSTFIKYANEFNERHKGFVKESYYTRVFHSHHEIYIKFSKQYESDGLIINEYNNWTVVKEDNTFKVQLVKN
ncbi:MAG TPA: hypothetical protein DCS67_06985 [Clostridiales bacterium UBA8960]|jgi:hypothetical protein|nr:hypothetical protein [Clostridiales bacterium UBA8960]